MRDTGFVYRATDAAADAASPNVNVSEKIIRQAVRDSLGMINVCVDLMGSFETLRACVNHVLEARNTFDAVCLVTGSLNYITEERKAKDIDVVVFVKAGDFRSTLFEWSSENDPSVDMTVTTVHSDVEQESSAVSGATDAGATDAGVRAAAVVKKRILPLYFVSRNLFQVCDEEKKNFIDYCKDECSRIGIKSSFLPVFKGFVISLVAIQKTHFSEVLKCLAWLEEICIISNHETLPEFTVKLKLYETDKYNMDAHKLKIQVGTEVYVKRVGSAPLRRGLTRLLREALKSQPIVHMSEYVPCNFVREMYSVANYNSPQKVMGYNMRFLNALSENSIVWIGDLGYGRFRFVDMSTVASTSTPEIPEMSALHINKNRSVRFWNLEKKPMKSLAQQVDNDENVSIFVMDMVRRFNEELPLISRVVEDDSEWRDGLCYCHAFELPDRSEFIYVHPDVETHYFSFVSEDDDAFRAHMKMWFQINVETINDTWYNRYVQLLKLLDNHAREDRRADFVRYNDHERRLVPAVKLKSLGPLGREWPVRHMRDEWRKLRQKMSNIGEQSATTSVSPPTTPTKYTPSTPSAPKAIKFESRYPLPKKKPD